MIRFISLAILFLIVGSKSLLGQSFPTELKQDLFEHRTTNYYAKNPIPFDIINPSNLHYRVKVGSFSLGVKSEFFKNYYPVTAVSNSSADRYYIGLFTMYQSAELARGILVESGFNGAFLVAFKNGKEISLSKAIELEQSLILATPEIKPTKRSDVKVIMTPLAQAKVDKRPELDSSKLRDNTFYLDYFTYDFENAQPVSGVNSDAEEIMPIIWPGDSIMSFVRAFSPENIGGIESGHDAWIASKSGEAFKVKSPFSIVNSKYNDAVVGINKDGSRIYLLNDYNDNEVKRGLSMIERQGSIWSDRQVLPLPELNFTGNFYGFYMHPDEDLVLISMQGKESLGMNDIYVIEKNNDGNWGALIHLDSNVNTDGNDISPYISDDKKVFIYSTDGMGGVGSNDLIAFKRLDSGWTSWSEPQNLGPEINTSNFEAYPFIYQDQFYYSSVKDSGLADIYKADILTKMMLPIENYLEMEDSLLFTYNVEAGILSNQNEDNLDLESIPVLAMVNTDSRIDMIYFDYDRYNLKPSFTEFLNQLHTILVEFPDIDLDLRGHTDSIGTIEYNFLLGENRALSVKDYLISIGVEPSRLKVKSFGKEVPIASNETAYGRAKNRRVEIRFIRKEN